MGPLTFGKKEEQIFLGREIAQHRDYSEATAVEIDREVKSIVAGRVQLREEDHRRQPRGASDIAEALLEREVLDGEQIAAWSAASRCRCRRSPADAGAEVTEQAETARRPGVLPAPGSQPA